MSDDDRQRWNRKHAARRDVEHEPLALVREAIPLALDGVGAPRALDVAAGRGRHALLLASEGFDVLAVDVSDVALELVAERAAQRGLSVMTEQRDVETEGLPDGQWDLVVVTHFLSRPLFPALERAVAPGGVLAYETFTVEQHERTGFNDRFCLRHDELRTAFPSLEVIEYRESVVDDRHVASLIARRPS